MNREVFNFYPDATYKYSGIIANAYTFTKEKQLMRTDLWERFVKQYEIHSDDADLGWKGEFWGKMMRGAALVCSYTEDEKLYKTLEKAVRDLLETQDSLGRIATYSVECEFQNWDLWCRKYVMLGMEYFLEVCKDEALKKEIIASIKKQADYIISKIGSEEGKTSITATSTFWRGLNSSSILEPIVRIYQLTGEEKYLKFAQYIIGEGGCQVANLFELAFEDGLYPYQYPLTKAYEMTSCFEGILEYYKVTGEEKYKETVIKFANKILESDFTVIGSCGCTHELFDNSTVRQANTTNEWIMQETCVTVTLMKFFSRIHLLTGDPKYIDAFEISFYNDYLGSFNTEDQLEPEMIRDFSHWTLEPMPFDSYAPLTKGTRGNRIGGKQIMPDNHYYGCCACIASAGIGSVHKIQYLKKDSGIVLNMFINGDATVETPAGKKIKFVTETEYPKNGSVKITIDAEESEEFELLIRNPYWSENTKVLVNGENIEISEGYIVVKRTWKKGDVIEISLDMTCRAIWPIPYGEQVIMTDVKWEFNYVVPKYDKEDPIAYKHIALQRGPVMLAQDETLGYSLDEGISVEISDEGAVDVVESEKEIPYPCMVKFEVPLKDGKTITLTDYASAGKKYEQNTQIAVWMLTE